MRTCDFIQGCRPIRVGQAFDFCLLMSLRLCELRFPQSLFCIFSPALVSDFVVCVCACVREVEPLSLKHQKPGLLFILQWLVAPKQEQWSPNVTEILDFSVNRLTCHSLAGLSRGSVHGRDTQPFVSRILLTFEGFSPTEQMALGDVESGEAGVSPLPKVGTALFQEANKICFSKNRISTVIHWLLGHSLLTGLTFLRGLFQEEPHCPILDCCGLFVHCVKMF